MEPTSTKPLNPSHQIANISQTKSSKTNTMKRSHDASTSDSATNSMESRKRSKRDLGNSHQLVQPTGGPRFSTKNFRVIVPNDSIRKPKVATSVTSQFDEITGNLKEFTIFGKLPPELRQMIWKALPEKPRIITVHNEERNPMKPSVLFFVTRESRAIALMNHICLRTNKHGQKIYFNPNIDTIYLREWVSKTIINSPNYRPFSISDQVALKIKYLALECRMAVVASEFERIASRYFPKFKNVEELILVKSHFRHAVDRNIVREFWPLNNPELVTPFMRSKYIEGCVSEHLKERVESLGGGLDVVVPVVKTVREMSWSVLQNLERAKALGLE